MFFFDSSIEIVLLAAAFSLINTLLNNKLGVRKRMTEIQEEFKVYQKHLSEAAKSGDESKMKKASEKSERMNQLMMEMMVIPWKTLVYALPLFFLFTGESWLTNYPGLIPSWFPGFVISLPFDLHPAAIFSFKFLQQASYGAKGFFIVGVLFASMIFSFIEQQYAKMAAAKSAGKK